MSKKLKANILLLGGTLIWGFSFVMQKDGVEFVGPFAFNGLRMLVGAFALLIVSVIFKNPNEKNDTRSMLVGGIGCGIAIMIATNLQQTGLVYTTAAKTAFVTPLYIMIVPLLGIIIGKRIRLITWLCIIVSVIGLYCICIPNGGDLGGINIGDFLNILCAIGFAVHILIVDHFAPNVNSIKLSCVQFFTASILTLVMAVPIDSALGYAPPSLSLIKQVLIPLLYTGIMSSGIAYTLQIMGQRHTDPTSAALILSLESVFGAISGFLYFGELLTIKELIGCILMFLAIVVSQLPQKGANKETSS